MMNYPRNPRLQNGPLPVDIVLHPSWWHRHEKIDFDADFFFHPARRVEAEQQMERALYERWGRYGLGADRDQRLPQLGAVHLASGYLLPAMLGCRIEFCDDTAPQVIPLNLERLAVSREAPFASPAFQKLEALREELHKRFGYVSGDVNWGGLLNLALDLRGQTFLTDLLDTPDEAARFVADLAAITERFVGYVATASGTTSISVNRVVRHMARAVYLHSECSNVMISTGVYERFFLPNDIEWSKRLQPFGIHHCGADPHRFARSYAKIPQLDFLDVGWGGDVVLLRKHLPHTFLNLRLNPVEIVRQTPEEIRGIIRRLVHASANPWLTGVCCINMDQDVSEAQVAAIFEEAACLRREYAVKESSPQGD